MRVAVGSDHAGFDLKEILKAELAAVGGAVAGAPAGLGVCVCGTGNGMGLDRRLVHQLPVEGMP